MPIEDLAEEMEQTMTGGSGPKRKGSQFEREIVHTAQEAGIDAKRAWGSNGQALGHAEDVDCLVGGKRVQCKRRASLASYLLPSDTVDAVAVRADRGEPLVVLRLTDWLELLKKGIAADLTTSLSDYVVRRMEGIDDDP